MNFVSTLETGAPSIFGWLSQPIVVIVAVLLFFVLLVDVVSDLAVSRRFQKPEPAALDTDGFGFNPEHAAELYGDFAPSEVEGDDDLAMWLGNQERERRAARR